MYKRQPLQSVNVSLPCSVNEINADSRKSRKPEQLTRSISCLLYTSRNYLLQVPVGQTAFSPVKQPLVHQVSQKQAEERKPFVLPEPAGDNSYLISYLNQERIKIFTAFFIENCPFLRANLFYTILI